jgi:hypothetical protein
VNNVAKSVLGIAATAGAVYFFDPDSGRRRRVLLRDQCARAARSVDLETRDARHNLSHRMQDLASKAKSSVSHPTSDKAICTHARKAIHHAVSHPDAIGCTVKAGNVFLRGDVFSHEHQGVLDEIRTVEGVHIITDHLVPREVGEGVRPLTNGSGKVGDGWSVTGRLLVGAAGCALLVWGVKERKTIGEFGTTVGKTLWKVSKQEIDAKIDDISQAVDHGLNSMERMADELSREADDIGLDGKIRHAAEAAKDIRARAHA